MSNCKNCSSPIEVKQGRRPREFCDNNQKCRNEYFRKNKKDKKFVTVPIEVWNELQVERRAYYVPSENSAKEQKDKVLGSVGGYGKFAILKDATKPTGEVKPPEQPTTNYTVNTKAKEGDPKEGTMAFFNKFGCMYYSEIKK